MKLCTYSRDGDRRIGFLVDDSVCDLRDAAAEFGVALPDAADLGELADRALLPALAEIQAAAGAAVATAAWSSAAEDVTLHAPYRPRQNILCAGGNTRDANFAERVRGGKPWLNYFTKAPTAVNDPGAPISWPRGLASHVYAEPQLAVVVGATTSFVDPAEALDHVFGYAVCTSISAADLKRKHAQWDKAVSLDTFFCWGPALVTADELEARIAGLQPLAQRPDRRHRRAGERAPHQRRDPLRDQLRDDARGGRRAAHRRAGVDRARRAAGALAAGRRRRAQRDRRHWTDPQPREDLLRPDAASGRRLPRGCDGNRGIN